MQPARASASRGLLTETVRARLKTLVPDLAGIGLDGIGALDARGRVVARIGEREADRGESVARHRSDGRCPTRLSQR